MSPVITPLGDSAVTVVLGKGISHGLSRSVLSAAEAVAAAAIPGVLEIVPGYAAFTTFYDPCRTSFRALSSSIRSVLRETPGAPEAEGHVARLIVIPVLYDGDDLEHVATVTGLSRDEVIARHHSREYHAYLLGFVPGFAYLGDLDPSLAVPRLDVPRKRVPAGSLAIAGSQTAVYPFSTPGGWNLIGRATIDLFDPHAREPALIRPGDRIRFERTG